jgi:eukaryotic-like serine/threonine-protein kinase
VQREQRLGRYLVQNRLGAGAFATVWLAYDEKLDSPVAIKVLAENWAADQHICQRFVEEGRFLRKVESPHVVTVYDAGELDDGRPYLVMEFADGGTLADHMANENLALGHAAEIVRQVGVGLTELHSGGLVHRDIKPANVLFRGGKGEVRAMVGDLGLGKSLDASSRLTIVGGTPAFVAPEQAAAEPVSHASDQYSLAAVAYLLVTGETPYGASSLVPADQRSPVRPPSSLNSTLPQKLDLVITKALAPYPADRFSSVTEFTSALGEVVGTKRAPLPVWQRMEPAPTVLDSPTVVEGGAAKWVQSPLSPTKWGQSKFALSKFALSKFAGSKLGTTAIAVGLTLSGAGGTYWGLGGTSNTTLQDVTGSLSVTVPESMARVVSADGWEPPGDVGNFAGLSAGTAKGWQRTESGEEGVFVGIFPSERLPIQVPGHPECGQASAPIEDEVDGDPVLTVFFSDCPGGAIVERVRQVTNSQLVWVQVRTQEQATANGILDSVELHGM